ncbi:MAG: 1-acyl-sn-glycerol-3-phosphate acyltransferase [Rubricella sp.]
MSYAAAAEGPLGRGTIRTVENLTGRIGLLMRLRQHLPALMNGEGKPFATVLDALAVTPDVEGEDRIPARGGVLVLSNHPFGMLDGLTLGWLLERARPDFRILANDVLAKAPPLLPHIIPMPLKRTRETLRARKAARDASIAHLRAGHALCLFPAGRTASPARPFGPPLEGEWSTFVARVARDGGVPVLPVFFEGRNGALFHAAGFAHRNLRHGLQMHALRRRCGGRVRVRIGDAIAAEEIARFGHDLPGLAFHLRCRLLALSPEPIDPAETGRPF